jgi:hypothetical protein
MRAAGLTQAAVNRRGGQARGSRSRADAMGKWLMITRLGVIVELSGVLSVLIS